MLKDLVPFLKYDDLRRHASAFLAKYNPGKILPIPIEEIIEIQLRRDIIPTPGLKSNFGIDGWITSDLSSIYVDEYQYKHYEHRYRFTLAHEISHYILHEKIYDLYNIESSDDFIEFRELLESSGLLSSIEWQADALAGLILVPEEHLILEAKRAGSEAIKKIPPNFDIRENITAFWDGVKYELQDVFNVSQTPINIRFELDSLGNKIKLP